MKKLLLAGALAGTLVVLGAARQVPAYYVEIEVKHSRFQSQQVTVMAGGPVTFVIRNKDPINHEFIVGDDAVHERHANGTDAFHGSIPGEVTVPALSRALTTFVFDKPGRVMFACHLPRHFEYGMKGWAIAR